jgi:hypothetical protein
MANIKVAKEIIKVSIDSVVPVWLWATQGVGKSDVIAQVAKEKNLEFIDIRAALLEAGDLTGVPFAYKNAEGITKAEFIMLEHLPQDPNWKGIIFFDELNRAHSSVLNAVFQLVLNRKILNHYTLPEGASIIAAGNPPGGDYQVTDVDPALIGRFCHINLNPQVKEWLEYAKDNNMPDELQGFIRKEEKMLYAELNGYNINEIKYSARSVAFVGKMLNSIRRLGMEEYLILEIASGLCGTTWASAFNKYLQEKGEQVDHKLIASSYKKVQKLIKNLSDDGKIPEIKDLVDKFLEEHKTAVKTFNRKELTNTLTFLSDIPKDVGCILLRGLTNASIITALKKDKEKDTEVTDLFDKIVKEYSEILG